jgi:hypothetical protein
MSKRYLFIFQIMILNFMLLPAVAQEIQSSDSVDQDEIMSQRLFHIERNKNANIVVYYAQLQSDGSFYKEEPVVAYWLMLAEDGRRQTLNKFEKKMAYGFEVAGASRDSVLLKLKADIGREIIVRVAEDSCLAIIPITNKHAYLNRIYIMAIEKPPRPKVQYMEIFGTDIQTGEDLYEKILP